MSATTAQRTGRTGEGSPRVSAARAGFARAVAALTLLLLVAGGMVTSTASGLAVPDWPLSYGSWLPAMVGGVFFEHGHRMLAAFVGLLILIMAFWTQFEDDRPGVRRLGWWLLLAVVAQGILGGVTVLFGLPTAVSASHAVLAQTLFCLLIAMAELTGPFAAGVSARAPAGPLTRAGLLAAGALWGQLALGAVLRHSQGSIVWHLCGAAVATVAAAWFAGAVLSERDEPALTQPAAVLLTLLAFQLCLGLATADFRTEPLPRANYAMIAVATIHLAVGALLLGTTVLLAFRLHRLRAR
ncbi:MAG: COX15/CtaA family protein [Elusimicrobia bacterium]|nr:COX15/CtaA family protein [Elusimicrobiota bacterium]